jgi:uncharacterized damage-inducible protein DinB
MAKRAKLEVVLAEAYAANEQMNQLILEHLDPLAWQARPPGKGGRTIAATFSHVHNVRLKWLRLSAPHLKPPEALNRNRATLKQAQAALKLSGELCAKMLEEALRDGGMVREFQRDGWAKAWPAGGAMFAYMLAHDAHHRGQVTMLAHQLGYPLPQKAAIGIWSWEKIWKQFGFAGPR